MATQGNSSLTSTTVSQAIESFVLVATLVWMSADLYETYTD